MPAMLRSRSKSDMKLHLRTALALLLLASVAHTSHSFFFSPSAHPPSSPPVLSCRSRLGGPGLERRRAGGAAFLPHGWRAERREGGRARGWRQGQGQGQEEEEEGLQAGDSDRRAAAAGDGAGG
ncbi:unnamed protein product [Ectocarpus fasciculatus]